MAGELAIASRDSLAISFAQSHLFLPISVITLFWIGVPETTAIHRIVTQVKRKHISGNKGGGVVPPHKVQL